MNNLGVGSDVKVVSGPHEGRSGRVVYTREFSLDGREPEPYAIVEFSAVNAADQVYTDHISVPVRRLAAK
jgi:hypothetical protein